MFQWPHILTISAWASVQRCTAAFNFGLIGQIDAGTCAGHSAGFWGVFASGMHDEGAIY